MQHKGMSASVLAAYSTFEKCGAFEGCTMCVHLHGSVNEQCLSLQVIGSRLTVYGTAERQMHLQGAATLHLLCSCDMSSCLIVVCRCDK